MLFFKAFFIVVLTMGSLAFCLWVMSGSGDYQERRAKAVEACKVPALVSEADGVKLFRVCKPGKTGDYDNDYVYFSSKGGASWDERRQEGKVSRLERYEVPNAP